MDNEDNYPFNDGEFDEVKIVMEEMTKAIIPIYKGFIANGLSIQEAAALTAAIASQGMPQRPPEPKED